MTESEHIRTTDNNNGSLTANPEWIPSLQKIADIPLSDLIAGNPSLLVFPATIDKSEDGVGSLPVFSLHLGRRSAIVTGNILGFIGIDSLQLSVRSRFGKDDAGDYFLYHMLRKVFFPNVVDMQHNSRHDSALDILPFLFPRLLHEALRQGLYKEYTVSQYNDSRVRGKIDVSRHLRCNLPFVGNVAYTVREFSYDNDITQLVRHTIEYIRRLPYGQNILYSDCTTKQDVDTIVNVTPSYRKTDIRNVIERNAVPLAHPYFSAYKVLLRLCLMILKGQQMRNGDADKVYGILFDGAWLWEEYVYTLIGNFGYTHPRNKVDTGRIWLFKENRYPRYPDFIKDKIILDAKYKRIAAHSISRDDLHQLISYMHITSSDKGALVNPVGSPESKTSIINIGSLNGHGGEIAILSLKIPCGADSFEEFEDLIADEEKKFREMVDVFESHGSSPAD